EGEPGDSIYLLARGEAKVTVRGRLVNVLHAGDCFGEMGYVQEQRSNRQATVETTADTLVAELPRELVDGLSLSCQLKFNRALLRTLADRLSLSNARLSAATTAREP